MQMETIQTRATTTHSDSIQIRKLSARNPKELNEFIDFAWKLYQPKNPKEEMAGWVPPLRIYVKDLLDVYKNPFYQDAEIQLFMAEKNGIPLGRIAAIENKAYNRYHSTQVGHYGFFECVNDTEIAEGLFDAASEWLKTRGLDVMQGPVNPSTNYEAGLLVRGHSQFATLMTTWNPKYYETLHVDCGMVGVKDMLGYWLPTGQVEKLKPGFLEKAKKARESSNIVFRDMDMKNFERDVDSMFDIYNSSWDKNWGFVPMTHEEFRHQGKDLKTIIDPKFSVIAEKDGKAIGFMFILPDYAHIYKRNPSGRLTPMTILKILFGKKMLKTVRIIALGVKPEHRGGGVFAHFTSEAFLRAADRKLIGGEASWILEDNEAMNKPWKDIGAVAYRRWRMYERAV